MRFRDKITANINLKDAIFGGIAIYVSVFLLQYVLVFLADFLLRIFGIIGSEGQIVGSTLVSPSDNYGFFVAVFMAVSLILILMTVLFEEHLFSSHEKGWADLLGLGMVWGGVFVIMDAIIESFAAFVMLFRGDGMYTTVGIQGSLSTLFFIILVIIITFLPLSFFFLSKGKNKS